MTTRGNNRYMWNPPSESQQSQAKHYSELTEYETAGDAASRLSPSVDAESDGGGRSRGSRSLVLENGRKRRSRCSVRSGVHRTLCAPPPRPAGKGFNQCTRPPG